MNRSPTAVFYERLTHWWLRHDFCDPACVFTMEATFVEAYCARAALRRLKFLPHGSRDARPPAAPLEGARRASQRQADQPRLTTAAEDALQRRDLVPGEPATEAARCEQAAIAFCDHVLEYQGVQGAPAALFMGYGLTVADGTIQHSCVADQASVASAVLETIRARPDHPRAPQWQAAIERWGAWVIANFVQANGGIGVGILSHRWNPIPEYWCATSLFAEAMFQLALVTAKKEYSRQGRRCLDWLAQLDYEHVEIPQFTEAPCEVILYAAEGMVAGLEFLAHTEGAAATRAHPVWLKLTEMLGWLVDHQQADGNWPVPAARGYRAYTLGLPWLLYRAAALAESDAERTAWRGCANRLLEFAASPDGAEYFGLYVRCWAMGLAWLSAGEVCAPRSASGPSPEVHTTNVFLV